MALFFWWLVVFNLKRLIKRHIRTALREVFSDGKKSTAITHAEKNVSTSSSFAGAIQTKTLTSKTLRGTCHVIDGDTIVIGRRKIRLAGIDAPELQNPYGKQSKWALVNLCKGQIITAHLTGETSYDRLVAICFLDDGRDLAAEMVKLELALDMPHFPNADYKHLETPNSRRKLRWKPKP